MSGENASDFMLSGLEEALEAEEAAAKRIEPRSKGSYVGAPACFKLEQCCQIINDAFGDDSYGCYLVGSALERPNWRDIDLRMMLTDEAFAKLFPEATLHSGAWEFDPRWLLLTISISGWLREQTGLPVDFQFQPTTHANEHHKGYRHAKGLRLQKRSKQEKAVS